jgi:hypothetical protein
LEETLQLAVDTIPFYLSNADYTPELADYFISHTLDPETLEDFYPNIQPLQEAISLYLKVDLTVLDISGLIIITGLSRGNPTLRRPESEMRNRSCRRSGDGDEGKKNSSI